MEKTRGLEDLERAKTVLASQDYTCVLCRGGNVRSTTLRGVKPLVSWLESGADFKGYCAADKVVGRATAYLYQLLGVKSVYAQVMSESALAVLEQAGIEASFDQLVPNIINRKGDGICPFEEAVLGIHAPEEAKTAIYAKMDAMGIAR